MIEKYEDLGLEEIELIEDIEGPIQPRPYQEIVEDYISRVESRLKDKLGVTFEQLKRMLSEYTIANAEELTHEFVNIVGFGDYDNFFQEDGDKIKFLKTEAHKPEHWLFKDVRPTDVKKAPKLLTIAFSNKSVDDGDSFFGYAYVNFNGEIKHVFTQGDDN